MTGNDQLIQRPEEIPGYTYGSKLAARSPLTLAELDELKQAATVDRLHAAFTKSVMLHVTVWSRAYVSGPAW